MQYIVLQTVLKEKIIGVGSGEESLLTLQTIINGQAEQGYRLHTLTTVASGSRGFFTKGDRIQATMVFEKI
jgi:hypothetical protein